MAGTRAYASAIDRLVPHWRHPGAGMAAAPGPVPAAGSRQAVRRQSPPSRSSDGATNLHVVSHARLLRGCPSFVEHGHMVDPLRMFENIQGDPNFRLTAHESQPFSVALFDVHVR